VWIADRNQSILRQQRARERALICAMESMSASSTDVPSTARMQQHFGIAAGLKIAPSLTSSSRSSRLTRLLL
jgi:hypothetical protein